MQNFGLENLKERDHLEDLGIDGRILDKVFSGYCECSNEPPGSIKGRKFLDWLSDC
jgi:hypothetical protein